MNSNNLKNIDVEIPLEKMVCVTGVSGSGKTSLVFDSFYQSMKNQKNIYLKTIEGRELIDDVILCDQSTIGKSSRSNPATYLEIYEPIRRLFAKEEKAKKEKLTEASFSFNVDGGRCETCKGEGILKMNMGFLPEVIINCPTCGGKKFKEKILDVKYKGLSISDVLDLSIKKAIEIFKEEKNILIKLQAAEDVGLGYLKLGQITSSLSGGESQRLKLAFHLSKKKVKNTLFIFDEPTKGLHFEDVKKLLDVMKKLVKEGSSLLIVEHNLDMIASSDYVIDIGHEGGKNGGMIVGKGTPLSISNLNTRTGLALRDYYSNIKD